MINANLIRKVPEELQHCSSDRFNGILNDINDKILYYHSQNLNYCDVEFCEKPLEKDRYIIKTNNVLDRKQMVRSICYELLAKNYDVQYADYSFNGIEYCMLRIKW